MARRSAATSTTTGTSTLAVTAIAYMLLPVDLILSTHIAPLYRHTYNGFRQWTRHTQFNSAYIPHESLVVMVCVPGKLLTGNIKGHRRHKHTLNRPICFGPLGTVDPLFTAYQHQPTQD
jgi:hypothetical protein